MTDFTNFVRTSRMFDHHGFYRNTIVVYPNWPLFHGSLIKNWRKIGPIVLCMNNEVDPEHRPGRISCHIPALLSAGM